MGLPRDPPAQASKDRTPFQALDSEPAKKACQQDSEISKILSKPNTTTINRDHFWISVTDLFQGLIKKGI